MTRMTLAATVTTLLLAGVARAQTPPPTTQNPPPTPPPQTTPATPTQKPATPVPFPAEANFAFVSLQYVVSESKYGKAGTEELKKFSETKQAQLAAMEKDLEAQKAKLAAQASVMSADAQKGLQTSIQNLQRKYQFEGESAQAEIQRLNADLLDRFQQKVLPIIEAIRTERKLLVIFAQQDEPGGLAVIAFHPGLDLSAEVVKRLDAAK
jgi:Skp family chaperone for outer membrane proteins